MTRGEFSNSSLSHKTCLRLTSLCSLQATIERGLLSVHKVLTRRVTKVIKIAGYLFFQK